MNAVEPYSGEALATAHAEVARSVGRIDLLLGHVTMLTADRWDSLSKSVHEAMAIALLMAAEHPSPEPVEVPGLRAMGVRECIAEALREVQTWDLALAIDYPDMTRLRVLLADLHRELRAATAAPQG